MCVEGIERLVHIEIELGDVSVHVHNIDMEVGKMLSEYHDCCLGIHMGEQDEDLKKKQRTRTTGTVSINHKIFTSNVNLCLCIFGK